MEDLSSGTGVVSENERLGTCGFNSGGEREFDSAEMHGWVEAGGKAKEIGRDDWRSMGCIIGDTVRGSRGTSEGPAMAVLEE